MRLNWAKASFVSNYKFSEDERWAVFSTHGQRCYICRRPIDYRSMHVDHVVPEHLLKDSVALKRVLAELGLRPTFDLNDFENWLPSCGPCNLRKSGETFQASILVQLELQRAARLAPRARVLARRGLTNRELNHAFAALARAASGQRISTEEVTPLLGDFLAANPEIAERIKETLSFMGPSVAAQTAFELRLAPNVTVQVTDGGICIAQGVYGTGYVPTTERPDASFYCGHCGSLGPWNGARCMSCGYLDDGD